MAKRKKSRNIDRWIQRNQNKHPCHCGCGEFIKVTRQHSKPSVPIPKFIKGHNCRVKAPPPPEEVEVKTESVWNKLSEEEKQRRLSQLKSFEKGEANPCWKGGRRIDESGYVLLRNQDHPFSRDGYVYEHRMVVEENVRKTDPNNPLLIEIDGVKYLKQSTVVHHIDEVKTNNNLSNLMLLKNQRFHSFIHNSPLPMEERIKRIKAGICHSRALSEEEEKAFVKNNS